MPKPNLSRLFIIGVVVLVIGINLSFGVFIFTLAGDGGPLFLLQALFLCGIVLNLVGAAVLFYNALSKWYQGKKPPGNSASG